MNAPADIDERVREAVSDLGRKIQSTVDECLRNGAVTPDEELCFKWTLDEFEYSDGGITKSRAHGEYVSRKSWMRASALIENAVAGTNEFRVLLDVLGEICKGPTGVGIPGTPY
jgi:hypothetical protein